jgi:pimeloyl-ACP methyl ester carboxylesterase
MDGCQCCGDEALSSVEVEPSYFANNFGSLVRIEKLHDIATGRSIIFGIAGDPNGSPVLLFSPLSGSCRMLLAIHDDLMRHSLRGICINRPGTKGTTPASSVKDHVEKSCSDTLAVLDFLDIERVGIFSLCAGTIFGLIFAQRHAEKTTGDILSFAPWTLPADCPNSRPLDRFAATSFLLPTLAVSYGITSVETTMMGFVSKESIAMQVENSLSNEERNSLHNKYLSFFVPMLEWIMGEPEQNAHDVAVCLSSSEVLGLDYKKIKGNITIIQGSADQMAPTKATQWLANQFSPPVSLDIVKDGTHNGALFILNSKLSDSLACLRGNLESEENKKNKSQTKYLLTEISKKLKKEKRFQESESKKSIIENSTKPTNDEGEDQSSATESLSWLENNSFTCSQRLFGDVIENDKSLVTKTQAEKELDKLLDQM